MDAVDFPRHTKALWSNRAMIEERVTFDSRLWHQLRLLRVLPETMIQDVMVCTVLPRKMGKNLQPDTNINVVYVQEASREERVAVLFRSLGRLGPRCVRRFIDVLHICGFSMVAEHLRFNG